MEQVAFDQKAVTSREWGGYPILTFPQVPAIDVLMLQRLDQPPLGAGESASVPSAAAIANAIFDATGVRFRELPFTPERVRAALHPAAPAAPARKRRLFGMLAAAFNRGARHGRGDPALAAGLCADPRAPTHPSTRGPRSSAAGWWPLPGTAPVCHTGPDGARFAGGLALDTPFGRVWSSNISPDLQAGIGAWSYPAFARAVREGISRDGHQLYPAHPYPAFAKTTDADLEALYAYLMAQPAVATVPPKTKLAFPFNLRPLMAGWNALFLRQGVFSRTRRNPKPGTGAPIWSRASAIAAAATRRATRSERRGRRGALAGGFADGWEAPPLTASLAPVPWTEDEFFAYLRTGASRFHGAPPGRWRRWWRSWRACRNRTSGRWRSISRPSPGRRRRWTRRPWRTRLSSGAVHWWRTASGRGFMRAPAPLPRGGTGLSGVARSLALNSNLHSRRADNLVQVILHGVAVPAHADSGPCRASRRVLNDSQVEALVTYLRGRFAPDKPAWTGLDATIRTVAGR